MSDSLVQDACGLDSLVGRVADEFLRRQEAGERPEVEEYAARHTEAADLLRRVLTSLRVLDHSLAGASGPAAAEAGAVGTLGDFRILREVGHGGMGVVYEAEQVSLGRRVALKVLPFAATMDPRHLQRFHNEARAAACLHHTNIVPVHYVGSERGVHFYAMQFIDGRDLASVIAQLREPSGRKVPDSQEVVTVDAAAGAALTPSASPAPATKPLAGLSTEGSTTSAEHFRTVARLGIQAAEALDHAHQMGIVHRDVKPANLLVDEAGRLWITDFGLAQFQSETRLTMTGDLVGTLRYMSPEQALAKRVVVDHRTDIYSLGATLYELLTLRPAFHGEDRQELLRQIAFEEPVRPRRVNKAIPAELETIVLKAMEKNPQDRYATAQELADDLRRWLEDRPIQARRPTLVQRAVKWSRRHRPVVVAGAASLLLALVVLAVSNFLIWREKQATAEALRLSNLHQEEINNLVVAMTETRDRSEAKLGNALRAMGRLLSETQKKGPLPTVVAEQAVRFYQDLFPLETERPALCWEIAWAHVRLGNLHALHDRFDRASAFYSEAHRHFNLFKSLCVSDEGERLISQERPAVEEEFRRALARWKRIGAHQRWAYPPDYRCQLAELQGFFPRRLPTTPPARMPAPVHRKKIALLERVLADLPTLEHRRLVVAQYQGYGDSLWGTYQGSSLVFRGYSQEARVVYLRALEYGEQWEADRGVGKADPGVGGADPRGLVAHLDALAHRFKALKASQEVGRVYRSIWKLLSHVGPGPYASCVDLARAARNYGDSLRQAGREEEARKVCCRTLRQVESRTADLSITAEIHSCEGLLLLAEVLKGLDAPEEAKRAYRASLALSERLVKGFPAKPSYRKLLAASQNDLAWFLATCASQGHRDPAQAILLVRKSLDLTPEDGTKWNTLGVAHYYAGDSRAATEALQKAVQLNPKGGSAHDFFFLAMAHQQLGDKPLARKWYDQAVIWMDKNTPHDEELRRFRAEAAALLGIEDSPRPKAKDPPRNK